MSNTGENAELIELLRDKSEDGAFCDFERHLFLKSAQAIAAADARVADIDSLTKALASESLRAETAETLLEEAWGALAPFIRLADNVFSDGKKATVADEVTLWCFNDTDITFGDLRRARACKSNVEGNEPTLLEEARRALEAALILLPNGGKTARLARATLDRIGKSNVGGKEPGAAEAGQDVAKSPS